ncbi:MAG: phosphoribosylformylglycinamidine cyclo-ligase [Planctomycetota bacterium]|nr:MAG: phosphoribosylformylglycinamidine cyclo-ligase [Planctomycetota bacterium]
MSGEGSRYAEAGVDVAGEAGALAGLLGHVRRTFANRPQDSLGHVAVDVGYFASVLRIADGLGLAVAADGVGTKLLVAQLAGRYEGVGIDLIAMNVNDLVCVGAEPFALLDYVAVEALDAEMLTAIGAGLERGAAEAGIVIAGGELAQIGAMLRGAAPGKAFDLAAVALGSVRLDAVNLGADVAPGDIVVGWASSGIHSNGLSLARHALFERAGLRVDDPLPGGEGTIADALLEPTRIYVRPALELLRTEGVEVTALAHITGGGFDNMARIAAPCGYVLDALPPVPAVFQAIAEAGEVPQTDLYRAFNMGVGFTVTVRPGGEERALEAARAHGIDAWVIGHATDSPERVIELPGVGLRIDRRGFHPA